MKVIHGLDKSKGNFRETVVTIGAFDALHIGHRKIITEAVRSAEKMGGESVVVTFDPHPSTVLSRNPQPLLLSLSKKLSMLESFGVDVCLIINFSRSFRELSPHDFVTKTLVEHLKAKLIVIGFNYVFGKGRKGNAEFLSETGKKYGFEVRQVEPVRADGETVSSTRIRELMSEGNVERAGSLLGRAYEITGTVAKGKSRGHITGYRTANLTNIQGLLPAPGVYAGLAVFGGQRYRAAFNLGWRPTFSPNESKVNFATTGVVTDLPANTWQAGLARPESGGKEPVAEVHIVGFDNDIYGEELTFGFIKRIRDEIAFRSVKELRKQIEIDVRKAS